MISLEQLIATDGVARLLLNLACIWRVLGSGMRKSVELYDCMVINLCQPTAIIRYPVMSNNIVLYINPKGWRSKYG